MVEKTTSDACSYTTSSAKPCLLGSLRKIAKNCITRPRWIWRPRHRSASTIWLITSTQLAKANGLCPMLWQLRIKRGKHHALELAEQQYRIAERGVTDADKGLDTVLPKDLAMY